MPVMVKSLKFFKNIAAKFSKDKDLSVSVRLRKTNKKKSVKYFVDIHEDDNNLQLISR